MGLINDLSSQNKADFTYWLDIEYWTLAESLCLSFGVEPSERFAEILSRTVEGEKLHKMLNRACGSYASGLLHNKNTPQDFINWLQSKNFTLPKELLQAIDKQKEKATTQADNDNAPLIFTHNTRLLRELLNAANKFWDNYDPTDKTTASTNETVEKWLIKERGVSQRVAEVMAQILRADHIPVGRK